MRLSTSITHKQHYNEKKSMLYRLMSHKELYIMMIPGLLVLIIYKYVPMGGLIIAFKEYSYGLGLFKSEWVGLRHFHRLFSSPDFWDVFKNTILLSFYKLLFGFPVPIILALLLNELRNIFYRRSIQTVIYLPHFLSWVIFGGIVINVLSIRGPINSIIQFFGGDPIMFLTSTAWFRTVLVVSTIVKASGWGTVVYLAAIVSIDPALYEAAIVDGANRFQRIWHITLPAIRGVIMTLFILRVGHVLDVGFMQILVLYNPAVYSVADVFETFVYRVGLQQGSFSFTTAVGIFKGVIGITLVTLTNKLSKKLGESGIW